MAAARRRRRHRHRHRRRWRYRLRGYSASVAATGWPAGKMRAGEGERAAAAAASPLSGTPSQREYHGGGWTGCRRCRGSKLGGGRGGGCVGVGSAATRGGSRPAVLGDRSSGASVVAGGESVNGRPAPVGWWPRPWGLCLRRGCRPQHRRTGTRGAAFLRAHLARAQRVCVDDAAGGDGVGTASGGRRYQRRSAPRGGGQHQAWRACARRAARREAVGRARLPGTSTQRAAGDGGGGAARAAAACRPDVPLLSCGIGWWRAARALRATGEEAIVAYKQQQTARRRRVGHNTCPHARSLRLTRRPRPTRGAERGSRRGERVAVARAATPPDAGPAVRAVGAPRPGRGAAATWMSATTVGCPAQRVGGRWTGGWSVRRRGPRPGGEGWGWPGFLHWPLIAHHHDEGRT